MTDSDAPPARRAVPLAQRPHGELRPAARRPGRSPSWSPRTRPASSSSCADDEGDAQHALPHLQRARWAWPSAGTAWPSARRWRSGSTTTSRPWPRDLEPAGTHDACFLPRPATSPATCRSTRWPGCAPRRRPGVVVRQHALLLPLHAPDAVSASCRGGGRRSSAPSPRRTAATSTAWACVDGQPRTSPPWARPTRRAAGGRNKDGGVLIDVASRRGRRRGLSMPHSPRWYAGRLWVLRLRRGRRSARSTRRRAGIEPVVAAAGVHPRAGLRRPARLRRASRRCARAPSSAASPIAEPADGASGAAASGSWTSTTRAGGRVRAVRGRGAGDLRRSGAARPPVPDLINDDPVRLASTFVLPDESLADVAAPFRRPV